MTNDINTLMSRIDEINAITNPRDIRDQDITDLIAYHRRARARKAAGEKAERPSKPHVDLSALLNLPSAKPTPPTTGITRRI